MKGHGSVAANVAPDQTTCRRCLNSEQNPTIDVKEGLCNVCRWFDGRDDKAARLAEKSWLASLGREGHIECLVGLSGGKDSAATLLQAINLGFSPTAFTIDTGYYPLHIFERAKAIADQLSVPHITIDARRYARPADLRSFDLTVRFHDDLAAGQVSRTQCLNLYQLARSHYSAKCNHALAFVRSCQLCRRLVIRAYVDVSVTTNIPLILLGMNEWTRLSARGRDVVSGVRDFAPLDGKVVRVVHVPFVQQWRLADTMELLGQVSWVPPKGEQVVASNWNSCQFASAANPAVESLLGFHVDSARLSREVTAGFLSRAEAAAALDVGHPSTQTVREVLSAAGLASRLDRT